MSELQKAIEEITYASKKFPQKAFDILTANKATAIPYLQGAIEKAIKEKDELEDNYQLHFYALYLLGEFQDKTSFSRIIELASLPGEVLDYLIGDAATSGLKDILYNTYNGDIELLQNTIRNECVNEFVRSGLLEVMGQLYLDGVLAENEWKAFIKQNVYSGEENSYFYDGLASVICKCHFVDMLPEIRYMLDNDLMEEMCLGKYDSCVDYMFEYRDYEKNFCESPLKADDMLRHWAMFEEDSKLEDHEKDRKDLEKLMKTMKKQMKPEPVRKIGRNDPCLCGSGKKYKFCCLYKPKAPIDAIESPQERKKCLERYPYIGNERQADRIYLEDYFDSASIEIDKLLYLGLMNRPGLIWLRDKRMEKNRCKEYLSLAFGMFLDKVQAEGIKTFEEYDKKFSIHYFCKEWLGELLGLLKESGDKTLYTEVETCWKEMGQKS